MSTFERIRIAVSASAIVALLIASGEGCDAEMGDCLRFSDCASGLTCASGHCVVPPSPSDAAAADATAATSEPDATSGTGDDESDTDATTDDADETSTE